jgi:hypothetical protein
LGSKPFLPQVRERLDGIGGLLPVPRQGQIGIEGRQQVGIADLLNGRAILGQHPADLGRPFLKPFGAFHTFQSDHPERCSFIPPVLAYGHGQIDGDLRGPGLVFGLAIAQQRQCLALPQLFARLQIIAGHEMGIPQ